MMASPSYPLVTTKNIVCVARVASKYIEPALRAHRPKRRSSSGAASPWTTIPKGPAAEMNAVTELGPPFNTTKLASALFFWDFNTYKGHWQLGLRGRQPVWKSKISRRARAAARRGGRAGSVRSPPFAAVNHQRRPQAPSNTWPTTVLDARGESSRARRAGDRELVRRRRRPTKYAGDGSVDLTADHRNDLVENHQPQKPPHRAPVARVLSSNASLISSAPSG